MSRRAHIVRTQTQPRGPSVPRFDAETFTWNAMLASSTTIEIESGGIAELATNEPRHTSLGADVDFSDDTPARRIRIPRSGIYSISARVHIESDFSDDPAMAANILYLSAATTGPLGVVDTDFVHYGFGFGIVTGHISHAGCPLNAGDVVWLIGQTNPVDVPLPVAALVTVDSLSVTYEAELGTVFPPGGG